MPTEPFIGDIYPFAFNFAPKGWAPCNGQTLPINQNQALFAILGTTYGGNGQTTFMLPNLQGQAAVGVGTLTGGPTYTLGQTAGEAGHTLITNEIPIHNHTLNADATTPAASNSGTPAAGSAIGQSVAHPSRGADIPVTLYSTGSGGNTLATQAVGSQGGGQSHENRQPYLALNYCIALVGEYPTR